jgi:uncharacterized protein with ParB-like and HNH nuclease domain
MISNLLTQIGNKEIVLPAIQRDFVWKEDRISMMFDSIMRGYPIGIILLWETYLDIKYREFTRDYHSEMKYTFSDNLQNKRIKLVLDGQQRLQSLYMAVEGHLDNKKFYFDILSGRTADDFREVFYSFRFLTSNEVLEINELTLLNKQKSIRKNNTAVNEQDENVIFKPVKELLNSSPELRVKLKNEIKNSYNLNTDEELRLELNMNKLVHAFTNDPNILKVSIIDENKSKDSYDRKKESDILEAFVRINRQGITLSRSDLIFSMLKLNWKESSEELPEFIRQINEGNNLDIDIDFAIRSLFAVSNLGSKFDVDLLRKRSNVNKVKDNYERTCNAIKALVDFLGDDCKILNSNIIGGNLNLIPFVYYLSNTKDNLVPNSEAHKIKMALYLFGFTRPFSRYGDNRIGKFIKEELKPLAEKQDDGFPLERAIIWTNYWESYNAFNIKTLQKNVYLTFHLLQGKTGAKFKYSRNAPEIDHIFPKSVLESKGFDYREINSYGNFWILAKTKNQNKSDKHPKDYLKDVDDSVLKDAFIDKQMLDYRKFRNFIFKREKEICETIIKNIGLRKGELDFKLSK